VHSERPALVQLGGQFVECVRVALEQAMTAFLGEIGVSDQLIEVVVGPFEHDAKRRGQRAFRIVVEFLQQGFDLTLG
jgi:hypothetical protein